MWSEIRFGVNVCLKIAHITQLIVYIKAKKYYKQNGSFVWLQDECCLREKQNCRRQWSKDGESLFYHCDQGMYRHFSALQIITNCSVQCR